MNHRFPAAPERIQNTGLDLILILWLGLVLTLGCILTRTQSALAEPLRYNLQPDKSRLYVQVFKDRTTLASAFAHDHVVAATGWSGQVIADPGEFSQCRVDVTVPVSGLQADLPVMRALVGYESRLSESDQKEVATQLRAKGQLDADHFPEIGFSGRSCGGTREHLTVSGQLTIRGTSKTVDIPLKITYTDDGFRATGTFIAQHGDFGFSPYSAYFGAVKNRPEIKFVIDVFATKK